MNRQWIYRRRPEGRLGPEAFEWQRQPVPQPGPGEVLVRVQVLSVDPSQRTWMAGPSYRPMLHPGEVMASYAVGEVLASQAPGFAPGDRVEGDLGWQDFACVPAAALRRRERGRDPLHLAGVLGITGATAYVGLFDVGRIRAGDEVLLTGAAGAVGTVALQLARIAGARVVAVAGGAAKCERLLALGADAVIDYKAGELRKQLKTALPGGTDLFFDNVGGEVLESALPSMNVGGRVVCCGAVSVYDSASAPAGPRGVPALLVARRLRMEGFVVLDDPGRRDRAEAALARWLDRGQLQAPLEILNGLENAPAALVALLAGGNFGKMLVQVA